MNSTDLSWLTAKQKRLITWETFAQEEIKDKVLKAETEKLVQLLSAELLNIWENNSYSDQNKQKIEDLERQLEQANEEARLRA